MMVILLNNRFLMQFEGFFIIAAGYFFNFFNGVEAFIPTTVGQVPDDAKIVMVVFLLFVVYGFLGYFLVCFVRLLYLSFCPGGLQ